MLLLCVLLFQNELLHMQDLLRVRILDDHPEGFSLPVDFGLPLEVRVDGQLDSDDTLG